MAEKGECSLTECSHWVVQGLQQKSGNPQRPTKVNKGQQRKTINTKTIFLSYLANIEKMQKKHAHL